MISRNLALAVDFRSLSRLVWLVCLVPFSREADKKNDFIFQLWCPLNTDCCALALWKPQHNTAKEGLQVIKERIQRERSDGMSSFSFSSSSSDDASSANEETRKLLGSKVTKILADGTSIEGRVIGFILAHAGGDASWRIEYEDGKVENVGRETLDRFMREAVPTTSDESGDSTYHEDSNTSSSSSHTEEEEDESILEEEEDEDEDYDGERLRFESDSSAGPPSPGENSNISSSEDEDGFSIDDTVVQTHPPNGLATPESSTTMDNYGEEGMRREIIDIDSSDDEDEQAAVQLQSPAGVSSLGTITEGGYNADFDGDEDDEEEEENFSSDDDTSAATPQLGGNTDSALPPGAVPGSRFNRTDTVNRTPCESFVLVKLKLYILRR